MSPLNLPMPRDAAGAVCGQALPLLRWWESEWEWYARGQAIAPSAGG
jgi:hypothetical protein